MHTHSSKIAWWFLLVVDCEFFSFPLISRELQQTPLLFSPFLSFSLPLLAFFYRPSNASGVYRRRRMIKFDDSLLPPTPSSVASGHFYCDYCVLCRIHTNPP